MTILRRMCDAPATEVRRRRDGPGPKVWSFAPRRRSFWRMGTNKRGLRAILKAIEHGPERSSLFWYMLDNHEDLARAAARTRIRWAPLAQQFAALGLLDGDGKTPTAENARRTWWNFRKEVAKRKAEDRHDAEPTIQPSRLPVTWRPQPATPPPSSRAVVQPRSSPATVFDNRDPSPEELLVGLRRVINERSGR